MFSVDCMQVGLNEIDVYVTFDGKKIENQKELYGADNFLITFNPPETGIYDVSVFCGGIDIPGQYTIWIYMYPIYCNRVVKEFKVTVINNYVNKVRVQNSELRHSFI